MRAVCEATGNREAPKRRVLVNAMSRRSARSLGLTPVSPASICVITTGPSSSVPETTSIRMRRNPSDKAICSLPDFPFATTADTSEPAKSKASGSLDSAGLASTTSTAGSKWACQSKRADGEPDSGASKKVKPRKCSGIGIKTAQWHNWIADEPVLLLRRLAVVNRMIMLRAPQPFPCQSRHIHFQQMVIGTRRLPTGIGFCCRHECDHRYFTLGIANDALACLDKLKLAHTHLAIWYFHYWAKMRWKLFPKCGECQWIASSNPISPR
jgi:hypothetical protein